MNHLPFDKPGRFYRGNLHTHSTCSDGSRTPDQVVCDYRSRGYDFVSITDHFMPVSRYRPGEDGFVTVGDFRELHTDDFITLPGAELHAPAMANGEIWHIVAAGLPIDFSPTSDDETGPDLARRAAAAGAFVGLAHPYWNAVSEQDAHAVIDVVDAIEVYNHTCELHWARGYGLHQAEVLLSQGHRPNFYAADDAHFHHPRGIFVDAFGGWVQVRAESLAPDAILAALKAGHYYSSMGPEFHNIEVDGDTIRMACSPVRDIVVSGLGTRFRMKHGHSLIAFEAQLPDPEESPYVRVTIVDEDGRSAWSNPIWRNA